MIARQITGHTRTILPELGRLEVVGGPAIARLLKSIHGADRRRRHRQDKAMVCQSEGKTERRQSLLLVCRIAEDVMRTYSRWDLKVPSRQRCTSFKIWFANDIKQSALVAIPSLQV